MQKFSPHLEILPPAQRRLWAEFSVVPREFVLYGGTAKASVVQLRAEARDYLDLDALLASGKIDLPTALAAGQRLYGTSFNPEVTLKALSYFDDGDLRALPDAAKSRLVIAARGVDPEHLPELDHGRSAKDTGYGLDL